jgi:hypothetical protein
MGQLELVAYFLAGAVLANAVPHLTNGVSGRPFQTPFANPPGQGLSSSTVNVLWGSFNLAVGYGLLRAVGDFDLRNLADAGSVGLGALVLSLFGARNFGRLHGGDLAGKP